MISLLFHWNILLDLPITNVKYNITNIYADIMIFWSVTPCSWAGRKVMEQHVPIYISFYNKDGGSTFLLTCKLSSARIHSFIHSVFCLTTGPTPLPKRFLHIVRSRASSFKWEYPLLSLRSSSSFLRLLPRLLVTSISPFTFPSITCFRRQFLRKMWPIQFTLFFGFQKPKTEWSFTTE